MEEINSNKSAKDDIFGGLQLAISKGESLQQAMQSMYNSGYTKEDIEKSARELQMQQSRYPTINQFQPKKHPVQKVSEYVKSEPKPKVDKIIIVILIILLVLLLGFLTSFFLFKDEVVGFFSNLLS